MTRAVVAELDRITRTPTPDRSAPRWIGVEHEFRVLAAADQVDFRSMVGDLGLGRDGLDPGDPRARRLHCGALLTADGREAEIASPPVVLGPGFSAELVGRTDHASRQLAGVLSDHSLEGYSTHLSVQVHDRHVVRTARRFVASCAPSMMLLMDRSDSPGLLVRPRRGRLELCGEHVTGDSLRAASVFAAAATLELSRHRPRRPLRLGTVAEPARERFGWYVDRAAFGADLYAGGRATRLGDRTAQEHLERSWEWCRDAAAEFAAPAEVALVDQVVDGRRPLPLECPEPTGVAIDATDLPGDPFGSVLHPRRRGRLAVTASLVSWSFVVLDVHDADARQTIHLGVPGQRLGALLEQLDAGALDRTLHELLAGAARLPVLASAAQTGELGAYGAVGRIEDLVPGERDPLTGRIGGPRGPGSRRSKDRSEQTDPPNRAPKRPPTKVLAAAGAALVLVVIGGVVAAAMSGDDEEIGSGAGRVEQPLPGIGDEPGPGADPGSGTADDAERRPLTADPCALVGTGTVTTFVNAVAGDYQVVGTPAAISEDVPGADPRFERRCTINFDLDDQNGSTTSGGVYLALTRIDPAMWGGVDPSERCTIDGPGYEQVDGIGDSAYAAFSDGVVCAGDVDINIGYGGAVASDRSATPSELLALMEEAATNLGTG